MQSLSDIQQAIERAGIIAAVRSRLPIDSMLEVGDALLATPLTVVAISPRSHRPWETAAEMRSRFGENMQIGAGPLSTPIQVCSAIDAGAQFVLFENLDLEVGNLCRSAGVLYVPRVSTPDALQIAIAAGWPLVGLLSARRGGPAFVSDVQQAFPAARLAPMGGVTLANLGAYARAGAAAAIVRGVLARHAKWQMAGLITAMRRLRAQWEAGRAELGRASS